MNVHASDLLPVAGSRRTLTGHPEDHLKDEDDSAAFSDLLAQQASLCALASPPPPKRSPPDGSAPPDVQTERQAKNNVINALPAGATSTGCGDIDQPYARAMASDTQRAVASLLETAGHVIDAGRHTSNEDASPALARWPLQTPASVPVSSEPTRAFALTASGSTDYSGKRNIAHSPHTPVALVGMRELLRLQAMNKSSGSERAIQALRNTPPLVAHGFADIIKQATPTLYTAIENQPVRGHAFESGKMLTDSREPANSIPDIPYLTASGMKANIGSHSNAFFATEYAINMPISDIHWPSTFSKHVLSIVRSTERGQQTVELRLDPPELGPLRVSLSVIDNTAQATFFCSHVSVRHAVENALPHLQQLLAQAGISLGQTSVNDQHHAGPAFEHGSAPHSSREHANTSNRMMAEASPPSVGRSRGLNTQIDIYA